MLSNITCLSVLRIKDVKGYDFEKEEKVRVCYLGFLKRKYIYSDNGTTNY